MLLSLMLILLLRKRSHMLESTAHFDLLVLLRLLSHHIHHMWCLVILSVSLTELLPLILVVILLPSLVQVKVFVSLLDGIQDLAALVSKLHSLHSITILVVHLCLCLLGVFNVEIVDKGVRAVICIWLSLLRPNSSYSSIFGEDSFKGLLVR